MESRTVYRCHYRALLSKGTEEIPDWDKIAAECGKNAEALIAEKRVMTAALYRYGRQLFLYCEPIGEPLSPEAFMGPMEDWLAPWPQKEAIAKWVKMYHVYWHCEPRDEEDWRRSPPPLRRRGRIAYLKHGTMFEYVYHHFAIVQEGLLRGDRYMSIAMHEDVLFSYFEEPRSCVNIRRTQTGESQAIQGWLDADPESHFIHLPGSEGQNFLLLPEIFALG